MQGLVVQEGTDPFQTGLTFHGCKTMYWRPDRAVHCCLLFVLILDLGKFWFVICTLTCVLACVQKKLFLVLCSSLTTVQ